MPWAQGLLGEQLLHEWLRAWALDDGLHAFVQREGGGWLPAHALATLAEVPHGMSGGRPGQPKP